MAKIRNSDVETYVRLLISEQFTNESDDCEDLEVNYLKDKQHDHLDRKPQTRQE